MLFTSSTFASSLEPDSPKGGRLSWRPRHCRIAIPVQWDMLEPHQIDAWVNGTAGSDVLKPAPNDALRMWPVSPAREQIDDCRRRSEVDR
jgi:hypothetical protein